jgi:hypothetical protein
MTPRLRTVALLMIATCLAATSARAQDATSAPSPPSTAPSTPASAKPASTAPAKPRSATKTHAASSPRTSRTAGTASPPRAAEPSRTLQDIHIEGEIPVPQVLFITARDQRRFMDLQHRRYLRTSQEVGEQTVFPSWIALIRNHPAVERKETPR